MDKEIYGVNEALILLKEGVILKDNSFSRFIFKKERISVYSSNSSFSLDVKEFLLLYKDSKFIIDISDDTFIDSKKDDEYYSFKHK